MESKAARFERTVMPHLDAAHNLARWLTRNGPDADDVVQEAYLRAFKGFDGFRGLDARPWLLTIVRNTCYTWMQRNRAWKQTTPFDEEIHSEDSERQNPENILAREADVTRVRDALEQLPVEFREVIVLRELEGMSYKEISDVVGAPLGTVMSRLARGRKRLHASLTGGEAEEVHIEL